jgi:NAD(P)-dependent dehydrogenase (short-subunit alcohol dehydrogenase family)
VDVLHAELTSQASVRALAAEALDRYPTIEVLVNNAGAIFATREITADGIEKTWALNHLAPFLLTTLLLDRLKASAPARIITTTSDAHKGKLIPFDDMQAEHSYRGRGFTRYGETKLANILFTVELSRRLEGTGVSAYCFHPGFVATGFNRNNGALMSAAMMTLAPFSRKPRKAAQTLIWLADSQDVSKQSGGYYVNKARAVTSRPAQDPAVARRLWEVSEEQVRPLSVRGA